MSKKLMALLLAAVLLLAAGCGKVENDPTDQLEDPIMKTYGDDFFLAQAKAMGDRMCVLVAVVGTATGLLIVAARPLALQWANLTPEATRYLSVMLFVCAYYAACGCMTNLTIAGIFPAGGDAKFGLMCDAIVMWLIVVPVGLLAAFVFKLPVLVVYALLNTDECIKMVPALLHYRKYRWLRNVTR